jgi:hypothetical protein
MVGVKIRGAGSSLIDIAKAKGIDSTSGYRVGISAI